jgi:hypothetical protein
METSSLGNRENVEKSLADIRDHLSDTGVEGSEDIDDLVAERLFEEHGDLLAERRELESSLGNLGILGKNDPRRERYDELNHQIDALKQKIRHEVLDSSGAGLDPQKLKAALEAEDELTAMKDLGMIDQDGRFDYPIGNFSTATDLKWHDYLQSVL